MVEPKVARCEFCSIELNPRPNWVTPRRFCSSACSIRHRHNKSAEVRFWEKVDKSGSCWIWQGGKTSFGYGSFKIQGKAQLTHRAAWFFTHAAWPDVCVLHHCDNPPCVNPAHLYLGTRRENGRDMAVRMRCAHTKLTAEQAREAKARYASGESQRSIAASYCVDHNSISSIIRGVTWKWIQ